MAEDLFTSLTRQVKEEVIENYLAERRLVEIQTEEIQRLADEARFQALKTGRRLNRLTYLMIREEMLKKLVGILNIPTDSYWCECLDKEFSKAVRIIRVRAITDRGKFRKLVLEAYHRLYRWMEKYRKSYEDLKAECRAVNMNIQSFQKNYDLLGILNFLRSMDTQAIEQKHFLGENFTAEEIASLDQKMYMKTISFESLQIPPPLDLPKPERLETALSELANDVYRKYHDFIKRLMLS